MISASSEIIIICNIYLGTPKRKKLMTKLFCLLTFLLPLSVHTHPGVGIVKDGNGNIYYTDLHQVWKINNGKKTIVVPDVHTHELYIDQFDNLYGEGGYYDDKTAKFYHYLWVLRPNGSIDTVLGMKEAYISQDFSLARDKKNNEFYIKRFLKPQTDTNHIYRKTPNGKEKIFAKGNFKDVNWLHPQNDGSLLYASGNSIFRVDSLGNITTVSNQINNTNSKKDVLIWGIWQDKSKIVYAAVFSDRSIKKIDFKGSISTVYTSKGGWAPLHGIFDNKNKLWVLEGSDNNDVRVTLVDKIFENSVKQDQTSLKVLIIITIGCIIFCITFLITKSKKLNRSY